MRTDYALVIENCSGLSSLESRTILGLYADYGSAALLLDNGDTVYFATDEVVVGKWFEVFPIQVSSVVKPEIEWTHLSVPFAIRHYDRLWREEWQESLVDDGTLMGAGPHFAQFAMPLKSAPTTADTIVKICAGVRMTSDEGQVLVICSSNSNPFGLDVAMNSKDCETILKAHTCQ
jgi:hypothetical protein